MKRLVVIALVLLLLPCLTLMYAKAKKEKANAAGGGNVEQEIKNIFDQGREAALKGDTSFQEKYLADDYVAILADGQMVTKDQSIQMRKSGAIKYESIEMKDVKVRAYGDTAILNSTASVKLTFQGNPISGEYRSTFVYVKQKDGWKHVSLQQTRVATGGK